MKRPDGTSYTREQRIAIYRNEAAEKQNGRCYWCEKIMDPPMVSHGPHNANSCTAEHLIRKQDGGRNVRENIVAACWMCNRTRELHPDKRPRFKKQPA